MLYLGEGPREITVGGGDNERLMQVFPDFSDPLQFYYLPNFPHVAKMPDGSPAIRLLVYREDLDTIADDEEEAVAFLSLDVDVSWPPDMVDQARSKLRIQENLTENPRLTPIFYREGSVKLMLLDAVTPEEGDRPDGERPEFVTKILGSGSPSLYGDNRAIFQATLPKKGAAALSGALDGMTPIGVVYSLTFAGLQPAFNIKAKVDWQKVYDHFSEQEKWDLMVYESEVQKSIDKLHEERVIQIESTIEGVGAEAMQAEHDKVMDQVRQLIFDSFFEATFDRETRAGDETSTEIVDTLTSLAKNGLTLGVGYTYVRKEVTVEELRTFDLDYSVRKAAERTIYPQAHMHSLIDEGGVTRDQLIKIVDGSDEVWKVLPFQVSAAAAWEADGIVGITVDIEYDDPERGDPRAWSTHLDPEKDADEHRAWMDRTGGNAFRYKYEVVFSDDAVPGPSPKVDSGEWRDHEGTILVVHPRELYEIEQLEVSTIPAFPFDRWPAVQAKLRYRSTDGAFEHFEDTVLKTDQTAFSTRFRVDGAVGGTREISLTYIGARGEREETGWMPMPQTEWVVEDPHPDNLTIRAVVAGDRSKISNLIVNLEYVDEANGIHETSALEFDSETLAKPQTWTVHLADPSLRRYRYRMTLITTDGEFIESGWIRTDAPTLPVGDVYVRRLTVQVQSGELDPAIERVDVKLAYADEVNGVMEERELRIGSNASAEWSVQLQDASKRHYDVTMTWVRTDGFSTTVGPTSRNDTLLVVPGAPPG